MERLILLFITLFFLTGCSKIRSGVHACKGKTEKAIEAFFADFSKTDPDVYTFDNYPGFRDWYRFPVHYPYHFVMIDNLDSGCLEKYDGGDIGDPLKSSVSIEECSDIMKLGWNREILIFERADHQFGIFTFATGECKIFTSKTERDEAVKSNLPEEKSPDVYFKIFNK